MGNQIEEHVSVFKMMLLVYLKRYLDGGLVLPSNTDGEGAVLPVTTFNQWHLAVEV